LIGLNERARLLGGSLRIESSRGVGTRLEVQLPLSAAGPQPHVATTAQRQETQ
jgi:signal transduction histidine kinase